MCKLTVVINSRGELFTRENKGAVRVLSTTAHVAFRELKQFSSMWDSCRHFLQRSYFSQI